MKLKTFALALLIIVPAYATADTKKPTKLADVEIKIVSHIHHVNGMEIEMGKLAQRVGTAAVKKYGQMLVTDHTSNDKDLSKLARTHALAVIPVEKADTDADKEDMKKDMDAMANLKKLKGAEFDKEYLRMMVEGHDKELARCDVAMGTATDDDLKTFLTSMKPTLQRHSDQAKELMKGTTQANAK